MYPLPTTHPTFSHQAHMDQVGGAPADFVMELATALLPNVHEIRRIFKLFASMGVGAQVLRPLPCLAASPVGGTRRPRRGAFVRRPTTAAHHVVLPLLSARSRPRSSPRSSSPSSAASAG